MYRNALAREVQRLGYAIERREHGFELAEISSNILERCSKRARERDSAIAGREAELGREVTMRTGRVSRVIDAMSFSLSCWIWFARRARRRTTGRSDAQAGRF